MGQSAADFLGPDEAEPKTKASGKQSAADFLGTEPEPMAQAKAPAAQAPAPDSPSWFSPGELGRHAAGALASVARGAAEGVEGLGAIQRLGLNALGVPPIDSTTLEVMRGIPGAGLGATMLAPGAAAPDLNKLERQGESAALAAGGKDPTYLEPQSAGDRYAYAGLRGLGSSLPLMAFGGPLATAASGIGGGLGAQGGADAFPGSTIAPIVGGVAGGGIGQGTVALVNRALSPSLAALARRMGSSETMEEAGTHLQNAGTKFLTEDHKALQNEAWKPIDDAIDPNAPVALSNYTSALNAINKDFGPMQKAAGMLGGGALKAKELLAHANGLSDPDVGIGPTWQQMANFRTYLGDNLSNARVNVDIPTKQMKQLYAGLTSDMRTAAHAQGVGEAFDEANARSQQLFNTADRVAALTKTGTDKPAVGPAAPAKVAEALVRGARSGGADLETLRAAHPDLDAAVNELAAAHLTPSETGTQLPLFHKLSQEGQAALVPYGKMREQAVAASDRLPGPKPWDISHVPVLGLYGTDIGRSASEMLGLTPGQMGAVALAAGVAPYAVRNAKALATKPQLLQGPLQGAAEGYEEGQQPDLVVRPRARTGG